MENWMISCSEKTKPIKANFNRGQSRDRRTSSVSNVLGRNHADRLGVHSGT